MYGWYDGDQVADGGVPKSACKLPHHMVSADGTPGAASANGVRNALARLPQTDGLTDAERSTIERHLRGHLPDDEDRARAATSQTPPVEPAAGPTPPPEGALMALDEGLRERLGLDADADEAAILTAVDELVDKATEPPAPAPEPVVEPVAARLPEGTVIVDKATLDELRQQASEGVAARAQQLTEARDRAISDAISKGKVLPARKQHWQDSWDADPDGTRAMLDSLAEGLIPLAEIGEPGGEPTDNGFDAEVDRLFSTPGRA
jgi:hypothetical protein